MVNIAVDFFRRVGIWGDFYHLKWWIRFWWVSCNGVLTWPWFCWLVPNPNASGFSHEWFRLQNEVLENLFDPENKKKGGTLLHSISFWMGPLAKLSSGSCHNDTFHETTWQARRMGRFLKGYVYLIVLKLIRKQAFIRKSWNQQKK